MDMEKEYYKFKVDEAKMLEIKDFYNAEFINQNNRPYDVFDIVTFDNVRVQAYKSKNLYTILFTGENNLVKEEVNIFFKDASPVIKNKYTALGEWEDNSIQIGSDEVGVGDFFLGFYVVASFLNSDDIKYIDSLGVRDSKKLTDSKIEEIGPLLLNKIKKHAICISPNKLQEYKEKNLSTHVILAKAHNFCHQELIRKYNIKQDVPIYIDQFEQEKIYLKYSATTIKNPIIFKTKGESFYPSIATSSVIARYLFLQDWKKMNEHFNLEIPKGASSQVDKIYKQLIKTYGQKEVDPYVKRFFRNYKE